jgi:hypothetical protein
MVQTVEQLWVHLTPNRQGRGHVGKHPKPWANHIQGRMVKCHLSGAWLNRLNRIQNPRTHFTCGHMLKHMKPWLIPF